MTKRLTMSRKLQGLLAVPLVAVMLAAAAPAHAQSSDTWRFKAALNLYMPEIGGTTSFPTSGGSGGATIDAQTILDSLNMAFMGSFEASKGQWGLFTDVLYVNLGESKSGFREISIGGTPIPAGASARADYDLKGLGWTLGGSWRAMTAPRATLDLIAGARLLDIEQTLTWDITGNVGQIPTPGRGGTSKAELNNWDAIIGVKGRFDLNAEGTWFAPYYFDVGTGESSLTWQAFGGVGYAFGWGDVVAAWRYIDYDMKSGKAIESLTFNGPSLSFVFRW